MKAKNMSSSSTKAIRVLLADDHPIVMTGFAMSLSAQGIDVIAQVKTPAEAIETFDNVEVDVAVIDIRFGETMSGFDVAKEILVKHPSAALIFLSQFDQDSFIKEAYRLGANLRDQGL